MLAETDAWPFRPCMYVAHTELRTRDGAVPVKIRLAVALRMFAGGSYVDIAILFGIAKESVFNIMWQVVDAINNTREVGRFFFPQEVGECTRQAERWKVCTYLQPRLGYHIFAQHLWYSSDIVAPIAELV